MNSRIRPLAAGVIAAISVFTLTADEKKKAISSEIVTEKNGDVFLIQEVHVKASIDKVWKAYTTSEGWRAWVAPVAEVDFKIGGVIKTNYRRGAKLNDRDTNTLRVINYVPKRVITLQADVSKNWPQILRENAKQMFNVITFHEKENGTKILSYGIGYKDTPEFKKLLDFFVTANEKTFEKLIAYVEK